MAHFMTDYSANSAIIYCIICIWIKEWELQNPGREYNFIHRCTVRSIYGRWGHAKTRTIYRFT
ncbi:hypothetical protein D9M68_579040 [compost metagenome]